MQNSTNKSNTNWKLKVSTTCLHCNGTGDKNHYTGPSYALCDYCKGSGKVLKKLLPQQISSFIQRPDKLEFTCIGCRKKEDILRPIPNQIPHGWLNWNSNMLCHDCKCQVILSAIVAIEQKVQQLKENSKDV